MRTWIKLYTEIVSDPKMGRLTDRQFRTCINLFALAGVEDDDGLLPATEDLAWHLRLNPVDLVQDLQALAQVGIIRRQDDRWLIAKWQERQAKPPSSERDAVRERVQRHRNKETKESNEDVTTLQVDCNAPRIEEEEEKRREETEQRNAPADSGGDDGPLPLDPDLARVSQAYHANIGCMTAIISSKLKDDIATYGAPWVEEAIGIATAAEKRNLSYVEGILRRWRTEGKTNGRNGHSPPADPYHGAKQI